MPKEPAAHPSTEWLAAGLAVGLLLGLAACSGMQDRAARACASYGLPNDPHCIMYVTEMRRQSAGQGASSIAAATLVGH